MPSILPGVVLHAFALPGIVPGSVAVCAAQAAQGLLHARLAIQQKLTGDRHGLFGFEAFKHLQRIVAGLHAHADFAGLKDAAALTVIAGLLWMITAWAVVLGG